MLSDSPPERDVHWTDAGVEGAYGFIQRLWRLIDSHADRLVTMPPLMMEKSASSASDRLFTKPFIRRLPLRLMI